jgi:hypothetical protein
MASRAFESRSSAVPALQAERAVDRPRPNRIPWYLWCAALAVTSSSIGGRWDVSWHESIGRDSFWTPAHMAIYLCGVLAGVVCGYLILNTTWRKPPKMVSRSVHVLGFTGPLGAFLAAWGGIAMLTSAPFDNWWHNAYGLDVRIISPPHTLLMLGSMAVTGGALFLILAEMNRAAAREQSYSGLRRLLLYLFGLILSASMFFCTEYVRNTLLHSAIPYIAMSVCIPLCYAMAWKASRCRWAATAIAAIYTGMSIGFILILPLFPAQPKLGPVYQTVTHFVPPQFPMLVIVPAILLDLLWAWVGEKSKVLVALASAPVFVLSLIAVEWPFASFLMTKAAENRFFATGYHPYSAPPWSPSVTHHFMRVMQGAGMERGLALATICAAISVLLGLMLGEWMRKIQR